MECDTGYEVWLSVDVLVVITLDVAADNVSHMPSCTLQASPDRNLSLANRASSQLV